jgi:hypothetical protein
MQDPAPSVDLYIGQLKTKQRGGSSGEEDLSEMGDVAVLIGDEGDDVVQHGLSVGEASGALVIVAFESRGVEEDRDGGFCGVGRDEDAAGQRNQLPGEF